MNICHLYDDLMDGMKFGNKGIVSINKSVLHIHVIQLESFSQCPAN